MKIPFSYFFQTSISSQTEKRQQFYQVQNQTQSKSSFESFLPLFTTNTFFQARSSFIIHKNWLNRITQNKENIYSTLPIKRTVLLNVLFEKIWNIPIKRTVH